MLLKPKRGTWLMAMTNPRSLHTRFNTYSFTDHFQAFFTLLSAALAESPSNKRSRDMYKREWPLSLIPRRRRLKEDQNLYNLAKQSLIWGWNHQSVCVTRKPGVQKGGGRAVGMSKHPPHGYQTVLEYQIRGSGIDVWAPCTRSLLTMLFEWPGWMYQLALDIDSHW